jgi:DMSO/TMAO reductase YedYZ heme-binding membrane subunit
MLNAYLMLDLGRAVYSFSTRILIVNCVLYSFITRILIVYRVLYSFITRILMNLRGEKRTYIEMKCKTLTSNSCRLEG